MFLDARKAKALKAGEHLVIDGCQGLPRVAIVSKNTWTYSCTADDRRMKPVAIGQWGDSDILSNTIAKRVVD